MATNPEWRSAAMGEPQMVYCYAQVEVRHADGEVELGSLEYELDIWWFKHQNGSSSTLHCFEDWRPYEEERA